MNKIIYLLLILLFVISIVYYQNTINELKKKIIGKEEEIKASSQYIESLKEKITIKETEAEIPKSILHEDKLKSLLADYFEETTEKINPISKISTKELQVELQNFRNRKRFLPDLVPLKSEYLKSQGFSEKHQAIDLAASLGSEVIASAAGVVKSVYQDKYFGNVLVIDHLNEYVTLYAHLAKVLVKPKFFVEKNETIALVGNSGNSTSSHLHYEILKKGKNINPDSLIVDPNYFLKE